MKKSTFESEIFTRGIEDIITREELEKLLKSGKKLRIKHGIDATSPDLHIGHAVSLWKLRALQEQGHKAVILLGNVTTRIGDPTGKLEVRPVLSPGVIEKNIKSIEAQIKKILLGGKDVLEIRRSSEWYGKMRVPEFLEILAYVTHARLIERDMFQQRIKSGTSIFTNEFIYPILQGYDSVMLKSDLTIIGSDQLFNEHLGRFLQEKFGQAPQAIVTVKILPGLDGGEKMSKSAGNYIGLLDSPQDKFGKAMRVLDKLIILYLRVYTDVPAVEIKKIEAELKAGQNPMEAKLFFAEELVRRYHGKNVAEKEKERFLSLFSKKNLPEDAAKVKITEGRKDLVKLLVKIGLAESRAEARRLVKQKGIKINGVAADPGQKDVEVKRNMTVQAGKRRFVRLV